MPRLRRLSALTTVAVCLLALPSGARTFAQEPVAAPGAAAVTPAAGAQASVTPAPAAPAASPRPEGRELAGHVFMPTLGLKGPFAITSFGTFLTLGQGSTVGFVTIQLPGSPPPAPSTYSGNIEYVAIGGVLTYEYEFLRGVSARVGLSESLYSGTTGASLAVVGTNIRLGFGAGVTAGLTLGESVRLAAVFDVTSAPRLGLLLGPAINSAIESCRTGLTSCQFDFGQLFQQQNVLELQPGLAASWAPHRSLGLTANLSYAHSSIEVTGANAGTSSTGGVSLGVAADFDFMGVSKVPVGLQLTWNSLIPVSGERTSRFTDVGGGLFYTGRKDLSLGLQLFVRRFKVVPEVEVSWTTVLAMVGLRYFW